MLDYQLDIIFEIIDTLCWAKQWGAIDSILLHVIINKEWNLTLLIALLTITACVKDKLHDRKALYEYALSVAKMECGKKTNILEGLE